MFYMNSTEVPVVNVISRNRFYIASI